MDYNALVDVLIERQRDKKTNLIKLLNQPPFARMSASERLELVKEYARRAKLDPETMRVKPDLHDLKQVAKGTAAGALMGITPAIPVALTAYLLNSGKKGYTEKLVGKLRPALVALGTLGAIGGTISAGSTMASNVNRRRMLRKHLMDVNAASDERGKDRAGVKALMLSQKFWDRDAELQELKGELKRNTIQVGNNVIGAHMRGE